MTEAWAAIKVAGSTSGTMLAVGNIEGQNISVTVAVTCAVFIGTIVWWLASKFQRIADNQEDFVERLKRIEQHLRDHEED